MSTEINQEDRLRNGAHQLRKTYSANEVASLLNYSSRTIRRWTATSREDYLRPIQEKHAQVFQLYKEGKKPKEIAEELNYALSTIYYILRTKKEA